MTARWASKKAHPRPTDRRTSTEATSSATHRDRSSTNVRIRLVDYELPVVVTIPQGVQQRTLNCRLTAESSTGQLTSALAPLPILLSPLRPLVVSYGDEAATLFTAGSRHVRRLGDSGDVDLGYAAITYSLAELASDM